MLVKSASLEGVKIITPLTNFEDFRGSYVELYNERLYGEAGINQKFIQKIPKEIFHCASLKKNGMWI
jgi:dTDP-4-dehydrorhamnose 3,5-epimerase